MALVTKTFSDIITFTRTSTATFFNSSGVLTSAGNNVPRFDYNPSTLAAQGLLIEEARTNSIRNNTMQGAVAGTPGTLPTNWFSVNAGLTRTVVGTGTENGITYIDVRFNGTTTSQFINVTPEPINNIAASAGQSWTASAYIKLVSGSLTNISSVGVTLYYFDSGSAFLSSSPAAVTLTSSLQRATISATAPTSTAFIQPGVYFNATAASGQAIDITLRIGLPQLEQGAFATSVIPTTTMALTRNADQASVNTLSPWYNASEGTLFAESSVNYTVPGTFFPLAASLNDNSSNNKIEIGYVTSAVAAFEVSTGGTPQATLYPSNAAQIRKTAGAYAANDFAVSTNGSAASVDTSGSVPTVTRLALGARTTGGTVIHLRRVTYYPRRLTNAELQAITA